MNSTKSPGEREAPFCLGNKFNVFNAICEHSSFIATSKHQRQEEFTIFIYQRLAELSIEICFCSPAVVRSDTRGRCPRSTAMCSAVTSPNPRLQSALVGKDILTMKDHLVEPSFGSLPSSRNLSIKADTHTKTKWVAVEYFKKTTLNVWFQLCKYI